MGGFRSWAKLGKVSVMLSAVGGIIMLLLGAFLKKRFLFAVGIIALITLLPMAVIVTWGKSALLPTVVYILFAIHLLLPPRLGYTPSDRVARNLGTRIEKVRLAKIKRTVLPARPDLEQCTKSLYNDYFLDRVGEEIRPDFYDFMDKYFETFFESITDPVFLGCATAEGVVTFAAAKILEHGLDQFSKRYEDEEVQSGCDEMKADARKTTAFWGPQPTGISQRLQGYSNAPSAATINKIVDRAQMSEPRARDWLDLYEKMALCIRNPDGSWQPIPTSEIVVKIQIQGPTWPLEKEEEGENEGG